MLMKKIRMPIGIEMFDEIRNRDLYYVDKTGFIEDLLNEDFKVMLITRPRRFGKTLMMKTLECFFDITRESRKLFDGLKVSENTELCGKWMNKYPVVYVSLKDVDGLTFENAYSEITSLFFKIYDNYRYLLNSKKISDNDKMFFNTILTRTAETADIKDALMMLTRMLSAYHGRAAILLIDEYDVPLAKASDNGYYKEMLDIIRGILSKSLKTNPYLQFAVVTGCLRIAKESIFTGTNNFVTKTISDKLFNRYFGFTQEEVSKILEIGELTDYADKIKQWYDGYTFSGLKMYCPWDVVNYVNDIQTDPKLAPKNYWNNTSHNSIIRSFIDRSDLYVNDKFEILLNGGCIKTRITEDLTYDLLHSSEENLWSILYLTGYLTIGEQTEISDEEYDDLLGDVEWNLRIPNNEIKSVFRDTVVKWFSDKILRSDRTEMFDSLWNGNAEKATDLISDLLFETISYHDYSESYYHAFLAGIFAGAGYSLQSNKEYGLGRPDIVIADVKNRRAIIIEVKYAAKKSELVSAAENAVNQIEMKKYDEEFLNKYKKVICYGAAFWKKECMILKKI